MHAVFVGTMFATLAGYLLLVQFDHDYLPDVRDGDSAISDWMDLSKMHLAGVVMLVCGFFSLHMLVLHAYVMRVQSYHDFRHMCAGTGGSGCEWPALGRAGAAEAHLLPVLRRGVYVGCEAMYATMFVVFVVFFVFQVCALRSPRVPVRVSLCACPSCSHAARTGRARRGRGVPAADRVRRRLDREPDAREPHLARIRGGLDARTGRARSEDARESHLARARGARGARTWYVNGFITVNAFRVLRIC